MSCDHLTWPSRSRRTDALWVIDPPELVPDMGGSCCVVRMLGLCRGDNVPWLAELQGSVDCDVATKSLSRVQFQASSVEVCSDEYPRGPSKEGFNGRVPGGSGFGSEINLGCSRCPKQGEQLEGIAEVPWRPILIGDGLSCMLSDNAGERILSFTICPYLHCKSAACSEHPPHLTYGPNLIRKEHQSRLTNDGIKRSVAEGEIASITNTPFHTGFDT
jgi:hypothetical protein